VQRLPGQWHMRKILGRLVSILWNATCANVTSGKHHWLDLCARVSVEVKLWEVVVLCLGYGCQ
jgi:hypothetical protein